MIGFGSIFRKSKRQVIRDNAARGKRGEEQVKAKYEMNGYKVERTGRGHDYKATKKNWLTGKKETKYVEVKTGNAELSPLQKKKKRSMGKKYVEERVPTDPFSSGTGRRSTRASGSGSRGAEPRLALLLPGGGGARSRRMAWARYGAQSRNRADHPKRRAPDPSE